MVAHRTGLLWVSPLPPVPSGVAQYSEDFLNAVADTWDLRVLAEPGSDPAPIAGIELASEKDLRSRTLPIYNIGNSGYHPLAYQYARDIPGITVLHDVVLHHARLAEYVRRGRGSDYRRLMREMYGETGAAVAQEVVRGSSVDLSIYPLSEDYVRASRLTVVHSRHACERVRTIVPDAAVCVVPMGIPLPALYSADEARAHMNLPESAFVITSITHVNPMKRLHIVLRALRRVVERVPEALLVIAGSVAPGMNLERQVALLGLQRHVRILGYVSDLEARALARAGDVSVNLRYPSTGETSASLLRLLGAARPVIVTAHGPATEIPEEAALAIPVDRYEEETLAEYLVWLAGDERARTSYGDEGRRFVTEKHSMGVMVEGYREAIAEAFSVDVPVIEDRVKHEAQVQLPDRRPSRKAVDINRFDGAVADAVHHLGLGDHDGTIQSVARAVVDLELSAEGECDMAQSDENKLAPELLEVLACPVCKTTVRYESNELICDSCGRHYQIENGIPVMLVDDDEK